MKEGIKITLAVIGFIALIIFLLAGLWELSRISNDARCKEKYGVEMQGRTGYKGSPQCVTHDGTGKYL